MTMHTDRIASTAIAVSVSLVAIAATTFAVTGGFEARPGSSADHESLTNDVEELEALDADPGWLHSPSEDPTPTIARSGEAGTHDEGEDAVGQEDANERDEDAPERGAGAVPSPPGRAEPGSVGGGKAGSRAGGAAPTPPTVQHPDEPDDDEAEVDDDVHSEGKPADADD